MKRIAPTLVSIILAACAVGQERPKAEEPAKRDPYFTPTAANTTSYMPRVIIRNIREDRSGNIWFATFGGPIRYDGKVFTNFSEEVGLANTRVFSLQEARSGALWFGSITGGATRYDGKSFTKFTVKDGLGNNDVMWIFEDRDANIWFGTGNGASRYDGKSITNFTTKDGLVHNSVYTIAQDTSGRIWIGTQGGICSYDGKSFANLADQVGRSFVNIRSMVVDRVGNLWFGGQEGAFRYDGKTLTSFTTKEGLLDDFVGSMIVDKTGNLWLGHPGQFPSGSGGGASRYDGKSFKHFTQKDGLGSKTVYCMLEDKAGNIWFGSVDAGASHYDGKTFTNFSSIAPPSLPAQGGSPGTTKTAEDANPMSNFARMIPGEWRRTFQSGSSTFDTWRWGPGRHSMRVMTDGSGAAGEPWRELQVLHWHPGRKQVCLLSLHPDVTGVGPGVGEGTIKFEGETADAVYDLYQPRGRRKIGLRWAFDGPDKYHATLLEATGTAGLKPLTQWDYVRIESRPRTAEGAPKPSERLKALAPLVGRTWEAKSTGAAGEAFHFRTTIEQVPLIDAIYARVLAPVKDGEPTHMLDAYIYRHIGTDALRCLALSNRGGVYEGDLTVLDGGALQLDLKCYEGDRVVPHVMRLDFEKDEALRQRVWSLKGTERTLLLDVHHKKLEPSENSTLSKHKSTIAKGETVSEMSKSIWSVFQDKNNNYWFGSDGQGVYRYDGKTITNFTTKHGLPGNQIRGIQQYQSGDIFINTAKGISRFDGQAFTTLKVAENHPPGSGWKLQPDDLWFAGAQNSGAVYRYDGTSLHQLAFPKTKRGDDHYARLPRDKFPNAKYTPYDVYTIYKDRRGSLWFGTADLGAVRYDGKTFDWLYEDHLTNVPEGGSFGIRSIAEDNVGKFWICNTRHRYNISPNNRTGSGLIDYKQESGLGDLKAQVGEDSFYFSSAITDKQGHLWMTTYNDGVWRYDDKALTRYPVNADVKEIWIQSIYQDNHGDLWVGTNNSGVYKFNGKGFEKFRP